MRIFNPGVSSRCTNKRTDVYCIYFRNTYMIYE